MKTINSEKLKEMFRGGAAFLEVNKNLVDSLNVFPVPDGDTGTNMSMTMSSAVNEINALQSDDLDDIAKAFSNGALKGARGNSGVILSQIMKGFAREFSEVREVNTKVFAKGLNAATEIAYNAVTKPKEGTILTVIRVIAESANSYASKYSDFTPFFEAVLKKGNEILNQTPEMLPVLKKAGVVDAGGKGLLCVLEGYYRVLAGLELPIEPVSDAVPTTLPSETFSGEVHDFENIKYGYCTEYFIVNLKKETTEEDIDKLKDKLMAIGDSVIVIGDLYLVKVHVHTNQPNKALMYALQLGEIDKIKVENMMQQNRELMKHKEETKKNIGMIAICAGEGIRNIFGDLLADIIIEGGQTMNPSVEDILSAIDKINSDNIIILPNNKNIILAAEQAKELTDKNVSVLPTRNIAQGISAAIAFDPDQDYDVNCENMRAAFDSVLCGQVTYAVRTTKLDGFNLKEGDIIGLDDKKIIAKSDNVAEAAKDVIKKLINEDCSVITLYYGADVSEEDAKALTEELQQEYEDCEIVPYFGGQPHYYYLIAIE